MHLFSHRLNFSFGFIFMLILCFCSFCLFTGCTPQNQEKSAVQTYGEAIFDYCGYNNTTNFQRAKLAYLQQHSQDFNGFIIGSAAASAINPETLNQYTGCSFYNLCTFGKADFSEAETVTYLLKHYKVKQLFWVLDTANTETQTDCSLRVKYSQEDKNLFLQESVFGAPAALASASAAPAYYNIDTGCLDSRIADNERIGNFKSYWANYYTAFSTAPNTVSAVTPSTVATVKELCEANGVTLHIMVAPRYLAAQQKTTFTALRQYTEQLSAVTDFWDFSRSSLSYDSRYFYENGRFRTAVGEMCLAAIFGNKQVYRPEDFGSYITANNPPAAVNSGTRTLPQEYCTKVPVLMYHHLDETTAGADTVTEKTFRQHMQQLAKAGVHTVSLRELYRYVYYGEDLPENPVLITFDDGYLSNYEIAEPILESYGMQAVSFAIDVSIGKSTYKDTDYPITPHYDYAQIRTMLKNGTMDVQSHTYDMHQWAPFEESSPVRPNILRLSKESTADYSRVLQKDIRTYQKEYQKNTGRELLAICYPSGFYDTLSEVTIHAAGIPITCASSTAEVNTLIKGLPQTLYALTRLGVYEETATETILDYIFTE